MLSWKVRKMTKSEFLGLLRSELTQNKISDADDVLDEYEQHFAFKLADGFSEEEIAARLGDPVRLARQFGFERENEDHEVGKVMTVIGLGFADLAAGLFFLLPAVWIVAMAGLTAACLVLAVCLIINLNPGALIPAMPTISSLIFGIGMAALGMLVGAGTVYFAAFFRQMIRAFGRFHRNTMAVAKGEAVLPALALYPGFKPRFKRGLRRLTMLSLLAVVVFFIFGMIISMIHSGALEFWHAWGWFGYTG